MEEVLVWVMADAKGTIALIGSFGNHGVIYRCAWADGEVDRGTYRTKTPVSAASDLIGITERAEGRADMILPPTVLRLPPPPYGRNPDLNDWVEAEVWPVVEGRMMALKFTESFVAACDGVLA